MMIQSPGSFVMAFSLSIQPGIDWTLWVSYLVAGILQGFLLMLCYRYSLKIPENEPLLHEEEGELLDNNN